jgi:hypothetical protein
MLIVRGDAQTLPSELNTAATGEVWFDPIFPKTDGVDVGTDTIWVAPNERHWHGATASTLMSHTTTTTIGATEFHEAVTEAEYATANAAPRD